MSTLILEGTLLDDTGQLQATVSGAIVSLAARVSMPVDSTGTALMSEDTGQAHFHLCGIARETTTSYVLFSTSAAIVGYAAGLPVTSTGAMAVEISSTASGNYCAGLNFTSAGRVRVSNGLS